MLHNLHSRCWTFTRRSRKRNPLRLRPMQKSVDYKNLSLS
jgi:hypothetical protein